MHAVRSDRGVQLATLLVFALALVSVIGCGGYKTPAIADTVTESAQAVAEPAAGTTTTAESVPAADILDRYVEVTGGKAAYEAVHNRHMTGTMELPMAGITGNVEMWQAEPNLSRAQVEIPGMGSQTEGCDGSVVWESSPVMGSRLKEGVERAEAMRRAVFNGELKWRELYSEVKSLGEEDLNGTPTYKVELIPAEGKPETRWFDKNSGLMLQSEATMVTQMGEIPVISIYEDYRVVDGIKMPFKLTQKIAVQEMAFVTGSVEHNVELADGFFNPPDEIKALMNKAASE